MCGGATAAVASTTRVSPGHADDGVGVTFAGRDIFAPVAAHLCLGVALRDLGTEIDVESLTPGSSRSRATKTRRSSRKCCGSIATATRNSTSIPPTSSRWVRAARSRARIRSPRGDSRRPMHDSSTGVVGLVVDSYGLLSLSVDRGSAHSSCASLPAMKCAWSASTTKVTSEVATYPSRYAREGAHHETRHHDRIGGLAVRHPVRGCAPARVPGPLSARRTWLTSSSRGGRGRTGLPPVCSATAPGST
jgi:hypothetical protein